VDMSHCWKTGKPTALRFSQPLACRDSLSGTQPFFFGRVNALPWHSFHRHGLFDACAMDQQHQFPLQQTLFPAEPFGIFHYEMAIFVEVDEICAVVGRGIRWQDHSRRASAAGASGHASSPSRRGNTSPSRPSFQGQEPDLTHAQSPDVLTFSPSAKAGTSVSSIAIVGVANCHASPFAAVTRRWSSSVGVQAVRRRWRTARSYRRAV
jgi:hypothetical protein